MSSEKQSSYRQIIKATSLFGGVQVFNIIIAIVRSKFIAILLGPAGIGIFGLLSSTTNLIGGISNFGLGISAVKNVSAANATGDNHKIATVVSVLRRLVWITGLLGTAITICISPWLSQLTFGSGDYALTFECISITLLVIQLNAGQLAILQGMRKLQYLAKADFLGMVIGLLISIPLYYVLGLKGIVPAIIISSLATLFFSWFFSSKIKMEKINVTRLMLKTEGIDMIRMGVMISLSSFFTIGASYIIRIYITRVGGVEQVGLYTAGFAIITTYVGMVFSAMGTDYYPRLAGVAHDNFKATYTINQQAEITILILAPILAGFLTFINLAIMLFYSDKFIGVNGMIQWAALGMFFKATTWAIGFVFLAKGATKIFFWNELTVNIYILALNVMGYKLFGLDGLGISFLAGYFLYFFQILITARTQYAFKFEKVFYKIFGIQFFLSLLCFITVKEIPSPWSYSVGSIFIILSAVYSYFELDKRLGLKHVFQNITSRLKSGK